MSNALYQPMTLDEFLVWEERQEARFEFDGFAPVAMTGGTVAHSVIQSNLVTALSNRLRGGPCRAHAGHLKIETAGRVRYPDAFVVCSPQGAAMTLARDPVVVFEVLSPGTSCKDRITKAREYGATDSIQRYVILEQGAQAATVFARRNGVWAGVVVEGDAVLDMPEIGISLPLAELYVDVGFPEE